MDEKIERISESYIEFKYRENKNILTITCLKNEIPSNDKILRSVIDKYKKYLEIYNDIVVIIDIRLLEKVNISYIWDKIGKLQKELNPIIMKKASCIVILSNNTVFKTVINSINKIYPPVKPFTISNNYEESMKFITSTKTN